MRQLPLAGIAVRWPQLVKLIKTVDTLGDVTTYLGAAAKVVKLPGKAAAFVAGKMGKSRTRRRARGRGCWQGRGARR